MFNENDPSLQKVAEFQSVFKTPNDPEFWLKLIEEEYAEVKEAQEALLKELCDLCYTMIGLYLVLGGEAPDELKGHPVIDETFPKVVDMLDISQEMFEPDLMQEAFDRVHASNMSKLQPDGSVLRREDGKILKPDSYQPPVLSDLLE